MSTSTTSRWKINIRFTFDNVYLNSRDYKHTFHNHPLLYVLTCMPSWFFRSLHKLFLRSAYLMTSTTTLFLVLFHSSQGHTCTITTFMLLMKRDCHNSPTLQEISTANGCSMNIELKMHGSCGRSSTSTMIWTNLQKPISSHNKTHHNARTSRLFQKKHGNICAKGPTSGSIILAKRRGVLKVAIYLHKYIYNAIIHNLYH